MGWQGRVTVTEKLPDVDTSSEQADSLVPVSTTASAEELETAGELVASARARGVALTGPDGLLMALTKIVNRS